MALIAREIAFVTGHMAFPFRVEHTPGVAHVLADMLSRTDEEGINVVCGHFALKSASRVFPAKRDRSCYRTLA